MKSTGRNLLGSFRVLTLSSLADLKSRQRKHPGAILGNATRVLQRAPNRVGVESASKGGATLLQYSADKGTEVINHANALLSTGAV